MKRRPKIPFTLTPMENRVLELYRAGLSLADVAELLGVKSGAKSLGKIAVNAVEKDRLRLYIEQSSRKTGVSSLSKARGHERMEGTK